MTNELLAGQSLGEILARIDREIETLLRMGQLSALDYPLAFAAREKLDRKANLKALLKARQYYRAFAHPIDGSRNESSDSHF